MRACHAVYVFKLDSDMLTEVIIVNYVLFCSLCSYNKACVTLEPELNNSFLNFSPIWNQRINESTDIVEESLIGPSLQSGTKLGLFSYLFDR